MVNFVIQLSVITISVSLQLLIVHIQDRKNQLWEKLTVIFMFKPVIDAYRIVMAQDTERAGNDSGAIMGTIEESIFCKCIEIFIENIPSGILQVHAFLRLSDETTGGTSKEQVAAFASILMSCMSTGYITSIGSYDGDIDPRNRKKAPEFWGFVPNNPDARLQM
jgi:hypothetical protein